MYRIRFYLLFFLLSFSIKACSFNFFNMFDKDNAPPPTPLRDFRAEVSPHLLWSTSVGFGINKEYLKSPPAVGQSAIYTASPKGIVTAVDKFNGKRIWKVSTRLQLASGPAVGDGIVVIGSRKGQVIALDENSGKIRWVISVPGEVLANPRVHHELVIIKTVNGGIYALSAKNGETRWTHQQTEPNLILKASSTPLIRDQHLIVGFAKGELVKLNLRNGQENWSRTIAMPQGAFTIQRMVDIDADPITYGYHLYVGTYQGQIAALHWDSGEIAWRHPISSYTGMAASANNVFVSDAESRVWAFAAGSGFVNWRQTDLAARVITGPAIMSDYVVVGDAEGYLHWLHQTDGHIAGRVHASPFYSAPVVENDILYALSENGYLYAYQVRPGSRASARDKA